MTSSEASSSEASQVKETTIIGVTLSEASFIGQ